MKKHINGYVTDLPAGCVTETDIYTDKGALLCPRMTVLNEKVLSSLSKYHGPIKATISIADDLPAEVKNFIKPDLDASIYFNDSFKKYATETLSSMFADLDDTDSLIEGAYELGDKLCNIINQSESLYVNLAKLKISDEYTYRHCVDVATMAAVLAKSIGESEEFVRDIAVCGLLHDIGKEEIPTKILCKPSKLTTEEFEIIKSHPAHGYKLLMDNPKISEEIRQGILNHHENMDGTGYPRRLKGNKIGKMAQLITIVDVYDALITERPYKPSKTPATAIETMFTMSNKFNTDYFRSFMAILNAFPNGSKIVLNDGQTATVVRQNRSYPLRPVIKLEPTEVIVDLSSDKDYLTRIILNFVS